MKTTGVILGVIGSVLGIIGGFFTQTIGVVGDAFDASNADVVVFTGKVEIFLSLAILVLSCLISKRPKIFGIIVLIFGVLYIVIGNIISGALILAGGLLGILSAKNN